MPGPAERLCGGDDGKGQDGGRLGGFLHGGAAAGLALEAMTVAMETGTPQTWECEHGRRHLSGLFVEGDES